MVMFEYEGYKYQPWPDVEPDNCKIFHEVITPEGKEIYIDWTPYQHPTEQEFQWWIRLGRPGRYKGGNLDHDSFKELMKSSALYWALLEASKPD